ncbi:MAG: SAM-dependent methyltransferase [Marinilabiliales bacterium]|nr:MAG: SAM-dependent methyltransferase [Marinilabiliales bacterium]
MNQRLRFALKFLNYWLFSRHKKGHGIHSPFVFNLVLNVFNNKTPHVDLDKAFKVYNYYKSSKELLHLNEIGAGSSYKKTKEQTVGNIIRQSSVNKKYGRLLYNLAKYFKSDFILEIGTSVGVGTTFIAQASPTAKFTTLEGLSGKIKVAKEMSSKLGHKTSFIEGNFDVTLESVLNGYQKLDFVFFDGNHTKESTLKYFELCALKSHNESIFIFDDIHWSKEMEEAWEEIKDHKNVSVSVDIFRMGLIFFKKELSKEHYVIKF